MGHAGAGIIMYNVLGGHTETMPLWVLYAGTFATVIMSAVVSWVFVAWAYDRLPRTAPVKHPAESRAAYRKEEQPALR
jgi:uncharacterized membrane protein YccC